MALCCMWCNRFCVGLKYVYNYILICVILVQDLGDKYGIWVVFCVYWVELLKVETRGETLRLDAYKFVK